MNHWIIRVVFLLNKDKHQIVDAIVEHIKRIDGVTNRITNKIASFLSGDSEDNCKAKGKQASHADVSNSNKSERRV